MANTKFKDLAELTSMTDSIIVPTSDGITTKKITGANLKNYFSLPEFIFRAQRIAGGNAGDLGMWTFTTLSGSGSASFSTNFAGNPTILITLTGFTRMPSVGYQLDNIGQLSSAFVTSESMNLLSLGFSGSGFVSPGSPNIITTFTPATHKFAVQSVYTDAKDFYFYFRQ